MHDFEKSRDNFVHVLKILVRKKPGHNLVKSGPDFADKVHIVLHRWENWGTILENRDMIYRN